VVIELRVRWAAADCKHGGRGALRCSPSAALGVGRVVIAVLLWRIVIVIAQCNQLSRFRTACAALAFNGSWLGGRFVISLLLGIYRILQMPLCARARRLEARLNVERRALGGSSVSSYFCCAQRTVHGGELSSPCASLLSIQHSGLRT
jgi:hypothetical protein